jgi:hypothetical protein
MVKMAAAWTTARDDSEGTNDGILAELLSATCLLAHLATTTAAVWTTAHDDGGGRTEDGVSAPLSAVIGSGGILVVLVVVIVDFERMTMAAWGKGHKRGVIMKVGAHNNWCVFWWRIGRRGRKPQQKTADDDEVVEMRRIKRGVCRLNKQIKVAREGGSLKCLSAAHAKERVDRTRPTDRKIKQSYEKMVTAGGEAKKAARAIGRAGRERESFFCEKITVLWWHQFFEPPMVSNQSEHTQRPPRCTKRVCIPFFSSYHTLTL